MHLFVYCYSVIYVAICGCYIGLYVQVILNDYNHEFICIGVILHALLYIQVYACNYVFT